MVALEYGGPWRATQRNGIWPDSD